jgi:hypothetical protein
MPKGLTGASEAAQNQGGTGNRIFHLRLVDDQESAKIRILTEHDELYWDWFHNVPIQKASGGTAWVQKLCPRDSGQPCELCAKQEWPSRQIMGWVYVYYIDFASQGEGRKEVKVGTLVRYRQEVNAPRLLRMSINHRGALETTVNRQGTLTDRPYEWIRSGIKGTNRPSYQLMPAGEPTPLPKDILDIVATLPDLEDVASEKVQRLSGDSADAEPVKDYKKVEVPADEGMPFASEGENPAFGPPAGPEAGSNDELNPADYEF